MESLDLFKKTEERPQSYIIGLIIGLILMTFVPSLVMIGLNGFIAINDPTNYPNLLDPTSEFYQLIMNEGSFFLQTVGYILVSGVFVVIFYSILKEDLIEFTSHWKRHLLIAIISFAVMYGLTELTNYIFYVLELPLSSSNQDFIINALKSETFIYVAISVVFLAPFVEEVIFRKLLFGAIESNLKLPKIVVVIISTVIFSLIHLSSELTLVFSDISNFKYLVAFFLYAPLAFVLSFSYSYSKNNIFTVIIVHMLNNLLSLILILVL